MIFDLDKLKPGQRITLVCDGIIKPRQEFVGLTPNGVVLTRGKLGDVRKTRLATVHNIVVHEDDRGDRPGFRTVNK